MGTSIHRARSRGVHWRNHVEASTTSLVHMRRGWHKVPRSWHKLRSFEDQFMNQVARKRDREREGGIGTWLNSFGDLPSRTQAIFSSGRDYYIGPPTHENRLRPCRSTHTWIAWPGRVVTTRLKTRSRQEEAASNWKGHNTPQGQPPAAIKWSQA
jgi:hypothetical protein